jgi:hypothetical protein
LAASTKALAQVESTNMWIPSVEVIRTRSLLASAAAKNAMQLFATNDSSHSRDSLTTTHSVTHDSLTTKNDYKIITTSTKLSDATMVAHTSSFPRILHFTRT